MKILLDCSQLVIGGALQVGLSVLEKASLTPGHKWFVVLSEAIKSQVKKSVLRRFENVHSIEMSSKIDRLKLLWYLPNYIKRYKPDIVFTVFGPSYWHTNIPHLQGYAQPTIIYPRMSKNDRPFSDNLINPIKKYYFRKADYLVVETETVRERVEKIVRFPKERIFVIRNSYSPIFKKTYKKTKSKNSDIFKFLVPSSYYMHKNLLSLTYAAKELNDRLKNSFQFVFTIPENNVGWLKIKSKAISLGVGPLFKTVGGVLHEKIADLYNDSDAVVLPTLIECSTAVYPESFMAEIPLATSDLDFARELCGNSAIYFNPFSPSSIADALYRIINESHLREKLVRNGKMNLTNNYPSPEKKWEQQLALFEKVFRMGKIKKPE